MTRTKSLAFAGFIAVTLAAMTVRSTSSLQAASQTTAAAQTVPPLDADVTPLTSKNLVGHRMWIMLFDKSTMQLDDVQRAVADATSWNAEKTPNVDVVAVAVIGSAGIQMLQDFTTNDAKIRRALAAFTSAPLDSGVTRRDDATPDLDALSSDTRVTGLKTICDALKQWPEKKEMLYFTPGAGRGDADTQSIYRDALNTCDKAHVTIDTIDARGLMALGRSGAPAGRGAASGSSGRNANGTNGATGRSSSTTTNTTSSASGAATRPDRLPPAAPGFSGTWKSDACSPSFTQSPTALWLGPMFDAAYAPGGAPDSISFHAAAPHALAWTFSLAGSPSVNAAAAPLAGDWTSKLSWDGDKLALTMAGTVQQNNKAVLVVTTHVLSFVTDDGARKGDLQVVTTSAPSGVLPDGVCTYKKVG